jgi:DNA polymerase-3 subunit chi
MLVVKPVMETDSVLTLALAVQAGDVASVLPGALARAPAKVWLLNLDDHCPPGIDNITRVLEIVSDDDTDKAAARERWRLYQAAGHDVKSFRLSAV